MTHDTQVRKLNTLVGLWVTGLASLLAVYSGCRAELAVGLFAVAAGGRTQPADKAG